MAKISKCTPFYYATKAARAAIHLDLTLETFAIPVITVLITAVIMTLTASLVFSGKMKSDLA